MKSEAFCPGHISCVFQPVHGSGLLNTGSRGFGIRLTKGTTATVSSRSDGEVNITMDGKPDDAEITRLVVKIMAPCRGFDIDIVNELPMSQGFGTSASGAVSVALCLANMAGLPSRVAYQAAHCAEVELKGGLGDVSAIMSGKDIPIRVKPGLPPFGEVVSAGFELPGLNVAVLGGDLSTRSVLEDDREMEKISAAGRKTTDAFMADQTCSNLFVQSNLFSEETGLETDGISSVLEGLRSEGYHAGMCMLGNSIFTDAPEDMLREAAGRGTVVLACPSSSSDLTVTRTE